MIIMKMNNLQKKKNFHVHSKYSEAGFTDFE